VADDAALEHLLAHGNLIRVLSQDMPCHYSNQADRYPNFLKHSKRPISSTGLFAAALQHIALSRPGKVQHHESESRAEWRRSMRRHITTGSAFEEEFAYSRAVICGEWCFVAGTTGYDYATMAIPEAPVDQARAAFATIERTLTEAGFAMTDIVRVQYTIVDASIRSQVAPALREALGGVRPAATMVVASLNEPGMKIEIEVTAFRG
jgi:enamine deaminase RidA (YjgF/YER057c/UK114 family)